MLSLAQGGRERHGQGAPGHKVRDDEDQDGGLGLDKLEHEEQQVHGEDGEAQGDGHHIHGVPLNQRPVS